MPDCSFPNCSFHAQGNGFCVGHKSYAGLTGETKAKTRINQRSAKMEVQLKVHYPAVKKFLALPENKDCHIKMEGCTGKAVCVHHLAGRIGVKLHEYTSNHSLNRLKTMWKKMYPKKFDSCEVVIEKEKGMLKTKSDFKKGELMETTKKARVSRGTQYRNLNY